MIDPVIRFNASCGMIYPGGPSYWYVADWDQNRIITVKMDEELESDEPAVKHLRKYVDHLPPHVYQIHVTSDGDLISASTDPKDDETLTAFRPTVDSLERPDGVEVVSRMELQELDRLSPNVDLVTRPAEASKKQSYQLIWNEMGIWMRLPKNHPNIVPFDKVVVDEIEGRVVGFTSVFIPSGTLDKRNDFKLKWLHQLLDVIDKLNFDFGIAHQDVAARNLLVNPETDSLMIFDFNFSSPIEQVRLPGARDDVKGAVFALYEIITKDDRFLPVRYEDLDLSIIEREEEWPKHPDVILDHPLAEFLAVLDTWVKKRHADNRIEGANALVWPPHSEPPALVRGAIPPSSSRSDYKWKAPCWKRTEMSKVGMGHPAFPVLNWQRPPSNESPACPSMRRIIEEKLIKPRLEKLGPNDRLSHSTHEVGSASCEVEG